MLAIVRGVLLLTLGSVVIGCRQGSPPSRARGAPAPPDSLARMTDLVPLDETAVVLSERSFQRLLGTRRRSGVPADVRHRAARMTAALSDPVALGVVATRRPTRTVTGTLFVVLRDAKVGADGTVEGRDAYVAAVQLSGRVDWMANGVRLALRRRQSRVDAAARQGDDAR